MKCQPGGACPKTPSAVHGSESKKVCAQARRRPCTDGPREVARLSRGGRCGGCHRCGVPDLGAVGRRRRSALSAPGPSSSDHLLPTFLQPWLVAAVEPCRRSGRTDHGGRIDKPDWCGVAVVGCRVSGGAEHRALDRPGRIRHCRGGGAGQPSWWPIAPIRAPHGRPTRWPCRPRCHTSTCHCPVTASTGRRPRHIPVRSMPAGAVPWQA
jgi:hypothetical protein